MLAALNLLIPLTFVGFQILELFRPARRLPNVKRWRLKGFAYFALTGFLSTNVPALVPFHELKLLDTTHLGLWMVVPALLVIALLMYWLHRARHARLLWPLHQLHHASERLDAASAAIFHPLDALPAIIVSTAVTTSFLGLSPEAAALVGYLNFFCAVFQHANIRTPRWIGLFIQRPEAHSVHHARGVHAFNYANLPVIDMLFGTHRNPEEFEPHTGLVDGGSAQNARLWLGLDVAPRDGARAFAVTPVVVAVALLATAGGALVLKSRAVAAANRPTQPIGEREELLDDALALPVARAYQARWLPQASPFVGPTSLANALRSWSDGAGGASWSDMNEATLLADTGKCAPFGKCFSGLTLDDAAAIARAKAGVGVDVVRDVDLATFRATVARANDASTRILANFHVGTLDGSKRGGHHSPIAGYLAREDLVLVMDVNAARGSFLVSTERLWRACNVVDAASGKARGLVVLQRHVNAK